MMTSHRKRVLLYMLILVLVTMQSLCLAQQEQTFAMPYKKVLRMSLDRFVDVYREKTHDTSGINIAARGAYYYYADCMKKRIVIRAHKLSVVQEKRFHNLIAALDAWQLSFLTWRYFVIHPGTLWQDYVPQCHVDLQETLWKVENRLQTNPRPSAQRQSKAQHIFVKVRRALTRPNMNSLRAAGWSTETIRSDYPPILQKAQRNTRTLEQALSAMPRNVQSLVVNHVGLLLDTSKAEFFE